MCPGRDSSLGKLGEAWGVEYLRRKGLRILETNYRSPIGEIDVIAKDGGTYVFVEIKTRRSIRFGEPVEAVTPAKTRTISRVALAYLKRFETPPPCRFDVLCVTGESDRFTAEWIKDAFEFS